MANTMIRVKCEWCTLEFDRIAAEHKRNLSKNRRVFCGNSCSSKWRNNQRSAKDMHESGLRLREYNKTHGIVPSQQDELSPFRVHMKNIKKSYRERNITSNITLEDLKELWDSQNGICPYTGWKMKFLSNTNARLNLTPDRASLDRIDSSIGYVKGNIQFICWMAQVAKNSFTSDELIEFCQAVAKNN